MVVLYPHKTNQTPSVAPVPIPVLPRDIDGTSHDNVQTNTEVRPVARGIVTSGVQNVIQNDEFALSLGVLLVEANCPEGLPSQ